jgi:hypothetical protein
MGVGFVAAFALYHLVLYAVAVSWLGGTGAFAPGIVAHVLLVTAVTLVGLLGLGQLVDVGASLVRPRRARTSPARFA